MEDFVYDAEKLGFYAEGEGSILIVRFLIRFIIFKRYFRKTPDTTVQAGTRGREISNGLFGKKRESELR